MKYLLIGLVAANVLLAVWNGLLPQRAIGNNLEPQTPPQSTTVALSQESQGSQIALKSRDEPAEREPQANRKEGQSEQSLEEPPKPAQCQLVGPYLALTEIERVQQDLLTRGIETLLREESHQQKVTYLVYIPASEPSSGEDSNSSPQVLLDALTTHNMDAALIPRGALKGNVSVGVFRRRNLADLQLQRVISLGYSGKLQPLVREQKVFHLLVQNATQPLPGELHTRACAEIAQEGLFL